MYQKVFYTPTGGNVHDGTHPCLNEVFFYDENRTRGGIKTYGILDSGAFCSIIPFSTGDQIGLEKPTSGELKGNLSGIGGNLHYVIRKVIIAVPNRSSGKIYFFKEKVHWIYPSPEEETEKQTLTKEYEEVSKLEVNSADENARKFFENKRAGIESRIKDINENLEPPTLLGRSFFHNFEYIKFVHGNVEKEDEFFFEYQVKEGKPVNITTVSVTPLVIDEAKVESIVKQEEKA